MRTQNSVKAFYNKFPYPAYDIQDVKDLDNLPFQKLLLKLIKKYKKKGKAVDVGCGTGELTLLLTSKNFETVGTDISSKSLTAARVNAKKLSLKTLFQKDDILETKLPPNHFDIAIANGVLHHTQNPFLGFCNLVETVEPGGIVVVVNYHKFGSLPRKVLGKTVSTFIKNPEKRIKFLRIILGKKYSNKSDAVIADAFFNPQETSFTVGNILGWFNKKNIKYLDSHPPINNIENSLVSFFQELSWAFGLKANVFILIGRRSLNNRPKVGPQKQH